MYKSIFIGRLVKTPVLEQARNGAPMLVMHLIVENGYTDSNGMYQSKSSNIRIPIFGPRATNLHKTNYLKQGHIVYAECETNIEEYMKNGVKTYIPNHSLGELKRISRTFAEMAATQAQYSSANTLDMSNMQSIPNVPTNDPFAAN